MLGIESRLASYKETTLPYPQTISFKERLYKELHQEIVRGKVREKASSPMIDHKKTGSVK